MTNNLEIKKMKAIKFEINEEIVTGMVQGLNISPAQIKWLTNIIRNNIYVHTGKYREFLGKTYYNNFNTIKTNETIAKEVLNYVSGSTEFKVEGTRLMDKERHYSYSYQFGTILDFKTDEHYNLLDLYTNLLKLEYKVDAIVIILNRIGINLLDVVELQKFVAKTVIEEFKKTRNFKNIQRVKTIDYTTLTITESKAEELKAEQERIAKEMAAIKVKREFTVDINPKTNPVLAESLRTREYIINANTKTLIKDFVDNKSILDNTKVKEEVNNSRYLLPEERVKEFAYINKFSVENRFEFKLNESLVVPFKAENGKIISLMRRSFNPEFEKMKYMQVRGYKFEDKTNMEKSYFLHNLDKVVAKINGEVKKVYLLEGLFKADALQEVFNKSFNGYYALALDTAHLSITQMYLLSLYCKNVELVMALDNDNTGRKGNIKGAIDLAKAGFTNVKIANKIEMIDKDENDYLVRVNKELNSIEKSYEMLTKIYNNIDTTLITLDVEEIKNNYVEKEIELKDIINELLETIYVINKSNTYNFNNLEEVYEYAKQVNNQALINDCIFQIMVADNDFEEIMEKLNAGYYNECPAETKENIETIEENKEKNTDILDKIFENCMEIKDNIVEEFENETKEEVNFEQYKFNNLKEEDYIVNIKEEFKPKKEVKINIKEQDIICIFNKIVRDLVNNTKEYCTTISKFIDCIYVKTKGLETLYYKNERVRLQMFNNNGEQVQVLFNVKELKEIKEIDDFEIKEIRVL